tara:strand:+ start:933 stop:1133 length:201 start_codon:yes stop_codon:yes gene_type:complete
MTRYFKEAMKVLDKDSSKLTKNDVTYIRDLYPMFSIEEYESIGALEEVIMQIAITPNNKLTTSQIA